MLEQFLEKLNQLGIETITRSGFKDGDIVYTHTINFPEASQRGLFLLGKVSNNHLTIFERIGMQGTNHHFGDLATLSDKNFECILNLYNNIQQLKKRLESYSE